jgi:hypothetical protein
MTRLSQTMIALLALAACSEEKTQVVKDKAYYLAHREELESENRACRDSGRVATDETCMRLGVIRTEILKDEIGARIKTQ